MSQTLYTQSIEDASLTLTNGGSNSDDKLLKWRRLDVLGINAASGTSTITLEMDFGSTYTADHVLFGNGYATTGVTVTVDRWNGSAWVNVFSDTIIFGNSTEIASFTQASGTKWRFQIARGSATVFQLACVFIGQKTAMPVSYQYTNDRVSFYRRDRVTDAYGYPYAHTYSTTKKYGWQITYRLSKTQMGTIESAFQNVYNDGRPFFFLDDNIDSNYHLVVKADGGQLQGRQLAADYFELPLVLEEL